MKCKCLMMGTVGYGRRRLGFEIRLCGENFGEKGIVPRGGFELAAQQWPWHRSATCADKLHKKWP